MPPKKPWDSTISDLSKYRISRQELAQRRHRLTSPNALAARQDLERRRSLLARGCSLEQTLESFAGPAGETSVALRELDAVELELHRLADDASGPQALVPPMIDMAAVRGMPAGDAALAECETPETPRDALRLAGPPAPWATLDVSASHEAKDAEDGGAIVGGLGKYRTVIRDLNAAVIRVFSVVFCFAQRIPRRSRMAWDQQTRERGELCSWFASGC